MIRTKRRGSLLMKGLLICGMPFYASISMGKGAESPLTFIPTAYAIGTHPNRIVFRNFNEDGEPHIPSFDNTDNAITVPADKSGGTTPSLQPSTDGAWPQSSPPESNDSEDAAPTGGSDSARDAQPLPTENNGIGNAQPQPSPTESNDAGNAQPSPSPTESSNIGNAQPQPSPAGNGGTKNAQPQPSPTGNRDVGNAQPQPSPGGGSDTQNAQPQLSPGEARPDSPGLQAP